MSKRWKHILIAFASLVAMTLVGLAPMTAALASSEGVTNPDPIDVACDPMPVVEEGPPTPGGD
jgi:hypothetical protein